MLFFEILSEVVLILVGVTIWVFYLLDVPLRQLTWPKKTTTPQNVQNLLGKHFRVPLINLLFYLYTKDLLFRKPTVWQVKCITLGLTQCLVYLCCTKIDMCCLSVLFMSKTDATNHVFELLPTCETTTRKELSVRHTHDLVISIVYRNIISRYFRISKKN